MNALPGSDVPRLCRWLIRACLPADRAQEAVDDLVEGADARRRRGHGTRFWAWRQAFAFALRVPAAAAVDRWRAGGHAGPVDFDLDAPRARPTMEQLMDIWLQDVRYALRGLVNSKVFTAIAVLTLGLGIGVNTAIFSVVNAFLFRPLPVPDAEQIVVVASKTDLVEFPIGVSYPNYLDYQERTDVLQGLALALPSPVSLRTDGEAQRAWLQLVSGDYFDVLGVRPLHGRTFSPEEGEVPGGASVIVLDHGYWEREYGADPEVVGRSVDVNGAAYTIIGVAPPEFPGTEFLIGVDGYVPVMMIESIRPDFEGILEERGAKLFRSIGRLQPGVTAQQASASLNALADELEREYPEANRATDLVVVPETMARPEPSVADQLPILARIFMGLVALVLLIALANIANLLITRASTRYKEIAIRSALGAGRARIVRQLVVESTVLGLLGGAVGVVMGLGASRYLAARVTDFPTDIPIRLDLSPDYRVFGFAFAMALVTGVLAGAIPAFRASRTTLVGIMKDGARGSGSAAGGHRLRSTLVVAQVAVSLVLLVAAGLFLRSLQNARSLDFGFRVEQTLMASVDPTLAGYEEARAQQLYRDFIERARALPGVLDAGLTSFVPFGGRAGLLNVRLEGRNATDESETQPAFYNAVGSDYFRAAGTTVLRGRAIDDRDDADAQRVALVNERMAQLLWPDEDPIGQRISTSGPEGPWLEIIGVAADSKVLMVWEEPRPMFYVSLEQYYQTPVTVMLHTEVEPASLAPAIRRELAELAPDIPAYDVNTMRDHMEGGVALGIVRIAALMVGSFGVVGLLLASIGLYGVIAFSVNQRNHEIGVRLALGADTGGVLKMVVSQGMLVASVGIVIGLLLALLLSPALSGYLLEVSGTDLVTYAVVVTFLSAVVLFACWVPARRAASVDPLVALRDE